MKRNRIITGIFFFLGIGLCIFPLVSGFLNRHTQNQVISTYETKILKNNKKIESVWEEAQKYNKALNDTKGVIATDSFENMTGLKKYHNQLNITGTGIMGTIQIPKIDVDLPIYHGVEESILNIAIGHLPDTSLPVGGINSRAVLTGHRGLPNAKLFTRLDELKKGDLFFLKVCEKTLAYKVNQIEVIEPEEADRLSIVPEKDLVSLVTCTPYGLNTHRLVVTGERIPYEEKMQDSIKKEIFSLREIIFAILPIFFIIMAICIFLKEKKRKEQENAEK